MDRFIGKPLNLWSPIDSFDEILVERIFKLYGFELVVLERNGKSVEDFWKTLNGLELRRYMKYLISYNHHKLCYLDFWVSAAFGPLVFTINVNMVEYPGGKYGREGRIIQGGFRGIDNKRMYELSLKYRGSLFEYWNRLFKRNEKTIPFPIDIMRMIMAIYFDCNQKILTKSQILQE
jgi:hypothetical protein